MQCLDPIRVPRFRGVDKSDVTLITRAAARQGLSIPTHHYVPCGKCVACRAAERNKWTARLLELYNESHNSMFVTLTYDDAHCMMLPRLDNYEPGTKLNEMYPSLHREHLHDFLTQFRSWHRKKFQQRLKEFGYDYKLRRYLRNPLKYYAVGDYGKETARPHYHIAFFNVVVPPSEVNKFVIENWQFGVQIDVQPLIPERCSYLCKYVSVAPKKMDYYESIGVDLPFRIVSRGVMPNDKRLLNLADEYNRGYTYIQHGNGRYPLPAYMKQKIFDKMIWYKSTDKYMSFYSRLVKSPCVERAFQSELYNDYLNSQEYAKYCEEVKDFKSKSPDVQAAIIDMKESLITKKDK